MNHFSKTLSVLGVTTVAIFASALPSLAATGSTDTEITVDCSTQDDETFNLWADEGESISVTHTNCDAFSWIDAQGDDVPSSLTSPMVLTAGDELWLSNVGLDTTVEIRTGVIHEARIPPGVLQFKQSVTIPADPRSFGAGSDDDDSEHFLGGKKLCSLDVEGGDRHVYTTLDVTIVKAGRYTFRAVESDPQGEYLGNESDHPIADSFLALYSNFDPANPDDGLIGCNDDLNNLFGYGNTNIAEVISDDVWMEGHHPYFAAELEPGNYTLLVTTWRALSKSEWQAGQSQNEDDWTPGPASLTFELWGPVASLCVGHDDECDPIDPTEPTLPPTGSNSGSTAPMALVALALGLIGVGAVKRRASA